MSRVVRSGRLTRSQERWWLRLYWREQGEYDIAWSKWWDLPPGIDVDTARDAFTALVERFEVLRTAFLLGPDHLPVQVVFDPADVRLPLSVADESSREEFRTAGVHPLVGGSIFPRPPWSVRLFTRGGEVRSVGFVFEHIVTDGSGLRNLWQQFLDLCAGRRPALRITHPLDRRAKEDRSASTGRDDPHRTDPAALVPQAVLPSAAEKPSGPRFLMSSVSYTGLLRLVDEICRRDGVSRTLVLTHAIAWLFARHAGLPRVLCCSTIGNRMPGDDSIDCVSRMMDSLLEFDESASFRESLKAASAATLRSYGAEVGSGPRPAEARLRLAAERGVSAVRPLYFNYQGPSQPPPAGAEAQEEVRWTREDAWRPVDTHWLNIVWINVDDDDLVVDFDVDTTMVPASVVHRMGDLLPRFLERVAREPDAPLATAGALLPADFGVVTTARLVGGVWVDTDAVREAVASCPGVHAAHVLVEGEEVVAQVSLGARSTLYDVHEHLLARLHEAVALVLPRRYRLIEGSAGRGVGPGVADLDVDGSWAPADGLPVLPPVTESERELALAFQETHGTPLTDLAPTYADAGGRVILAPALVESLRRRGLTGLTFGHFDTPRTLRSLARSLVRAEQAHTG
ncbi:hypothetical protein PS467_39675 [Streptomyces luomodiensis]|uniref:Condensation domain-containing protein n=1 Tax=Streptomyces luomodiensis TaxID=3026192 RepID=A0ABY9VBK9_9ACTN|nr:condensation domain-containing protein [Streptomyces sp. SCA4-21]WNF01029.1 hypothetical protein PS467_39675 [Streptomyces sp. SCA4-21]